MSLLDALFPVWAAKRARARLMAKADGLRLHALSAYAAAEKTRTASDWRTPQYSADGAAIPDLPAINSRARQLVRDHWAAKSIINAYVRHVVGSGITCRSTAQDTEGRPLDDWNKRVDELWYQWACEPRLCDIEQRKTLVEIQRLLVSERITVGEMFVLNRRVIRPDAVGLQLQSVEVEQLAEQYTAYFRKTADTNLRGGIEVDEFGAPQTYYIYTGLHPLDTIAGSMPTEVPASSVLHYFEQERARQTRGVSKLAPVLHKLRHIQMYDDYTMVRARMEACIGMAITRNPLDTGSGVPGLAGNSGDSLTDTRGNRQFRFEPGMVWEGEANAVQFFDPKTPGSMYEPFILFQIKMIAAAVGLDYATVAMDFTNGNFSSQREGHLERDKAIDAEQERLVTLILQPIRERFIDDAVRGGFLLAPADYETDPLARRRYLAADWQPPPKAWIDPAKQAAGVKLMREMGLSTAQIEANMLGYHWRDLFAQLAEERKEADRLGIQIVGTNAEPKAAPQEARPTYGQGESNAEVEATATETESSPAA